MVSGTGQTFEEKVEEDFLFFLEHYREAFETLKSEGEKEICKVSETYERGGP